MITENSSGTQACSISTEHDLATITTAKTYVLGLDLNALAIGDSLVARAYAKVTSGGTERLLAEETFVGVQNEPAWFSIPLPIAHHIRFSIEQTAGTGRSVPWSIISLD